MSLSNAASLKEVIDTFEDINNRLISRNGVTNVTGVARWDDNGVAIYHPGGYYPVPSPGRSELKVSEQLLNTVGYILNGKKWASGLGVPSSLEASFTDLRGKTYNYKYVDIVLDFIPRIIICHGYSDQQYKGESMSLYNTIFKSYNGINETCKVFQCDSYLINDSTSNNLKIDNSINVGNGVYRIPILSRTLITNYNWMAIQ